ncbi:MULTISPECIES: hypothetical protein [unclassified Microcoleus]
MVKDSYPNVPSSGASALGMIGAEAKTVVSQLVAVGKVELRVKY